ncbi:MAG: O-antigen ligase family protein [Alphaproteobacteria bacterium]|nr:O-antigen ligase family protein [Alphaproteobacteria bacterium]
MALRDRLLPWQGVAFGGAMLLPATALAPAAGGLVFTLAAVWSLASLWARGEIRARMAMPVLGVLAALVIWAVATAPFGLDPRASLGSAGILALVFLGAVALLGAATTVQDAERERLLQWVMVGWALGLALVAIQVFGDNAIERLRRAIQGRDEPFFAAVQNRSLVILLLLAAPAVLILFRRAGAWAAAGFGVGAFAILLSGESSTAKLALAVGAGAGLAFAFGGPRLGRVAAILAAVMVLSAPIQGRLLPAPEAIRAADPDAKSSALHRLYIWRFVGERIEERPILGWGLDAARRIPGGEATTPVGGKYVSLHPHSAPLQIWLELGVVGALLGAALVAMIFNSIGRIPERVERAGAAFVAAAALVVAGLGYGIWQVWWLATLALAAAVIRVASYPAPRERL